MELLSIMSSVGRLTQKADFFLIPDFRPSLTGPKVIWKKMTINWIDSSQFIIQPWKNGLGETLELIRRPDPQALDGFLLRLSMAWVKTSGPFSNFPGIDRHLILVEGEKLELKRENGDLLNLRKHGMVSFAGEENISCQVSDPCRDFNVMVKRGWKEAKVRILHLPKKGTLRVSSNSYLYQLSGELKYQNMTKSTDTLWQIDSDIEIESLSDSTSILINLI
jgi:environmental stress-induced protein Ves